MIIDQLPLNADSYRYTITLPIGSADFIFHLFKAGEYFYMSVHTSADIPIKGLVSRRLVNDWNLSRLARSIQAPEKALVALGDVMASLGIDGFIYAI